MDFDTSYFEIFGLSPAVEIDQQQLSGRFRQLQQKFHPDRHADRSEQDQRLALQYAAHINQAYAVLSSTVARAHYLLDLQGEDTSASNLASDPEFLMSQMMLREQLEDLPSEADPDSAVEEFIEQREQDMHGLLADFKQSYEAEDWAQCRELISKMQFQAKLLQEAEDLADQMLAD